MVGATTTAIATDVASPPRSVSVLGITGSIGQSTRAVLQRSADAYRVEAVSAHADVAGLAEAARALEAAVAVIGREDLYGDLVEALSGSGIEVAAGLSALAEAAVRPVDTVVAAISGSAGLAPTHAALAAGNNIALATKECLVSAGDLFASTSSMSGGRLLPVDSEHNAIFQILQGRPHEEIEKIILTASGGPFLTWSIEEIAAATPADALKHPNWSMGSKITIDSATMMNKGLEVIEAFHVFDVSKDQLDVLVHPESVVHGLVEFRDGVQFASMGVTDMQGPIAHCLAWPEPPIAPQERLDLASVGSLTFRKLDEAKYPAFGVAMAALDAGGWATNILSAANEIAVEAFLNRHIGFRDIHGIVSDAVETAASMTGIATPASLEEAIELDALGRRLATDLVATNGRRA